MQTKLTILGTGNAMVTRCYNTCFSLTTDRGTLLIDAGGGNGIFRRLDAANIDFSDIRALFLTHGHTDHALGVIWVLRKITALMKQGKYEGNFDVYAHSDAIALLRTVTELMLPAKFLKLFDDRVIFHIVEDGDTASVLGMGLTFFDIRSTKLRQFGFTALLPSGKRLTCLGDEPFDAHAEPYARGCDLLMSEAFCLYRDRETYKPYEKNHSTALDAGKMATDLQVKSLLLYHTEDDHLDSRKQTYTEEAAAHFAGPILVPDDLETYTL